MPPLQLFGRSWHISSDDLALPGIFGVLFHGTWSLLIILDVAIIGLPNDCSQWQLATASILWLLTSFVLTTCLQVWVTAISLRGAMLEEQKRANMPAALYCLLSAYCLEAAALTMNTVVFFGVINDGGACYTAAELARTSIADLAVQRWFIYTTWVVLGVVGGLLILLYNVYPDRSLDAWVDRVTCLSYALCCWRSLGTADTSSMEPSGAKSSAATPTVLRLAKVLGDVFYPLNFSFTDIVAAITLVGITHRSRAHGTGSSSHSHAVIAAAAAGLFGRGGTGRQSYAEAAAALDAAAARTGSKRPAGAAGSETRSRHEACRCSTVDIPQSPISTAAPNSAAHSFESSGSGSADPVASVQQQAPAAAVGMPISKSHHQLLQLLLEEGSLVTSSPGQQQQVGLHQSSGLSSSSSAATVARQSTYSNNSISSIGQKPWLTSKGVLGSPRTGGISGLVQLPAVFRSRFARRGIRMSQSDGDVLNAAAEAVAAAAATDSKVSGSNAVASSNSSRFDIHVSPFASATAAATTAAAGVSSSSSNVGRHTAVSGSSFSSVWERAVRQASALAVAPGYGVNPAVRHGSNMLQIPRVQLSSRRDTEPLQIEPQQTLLQSARRSRAHSWAGGLDAMEPNSQALDVTQGSGSTGEVQGLVLAESDQGSEHLEHSGSRALDLTGVSSARSKGETAHAVPGLTHVVQRPQQRQQQQQKVSFKDLGCSSPLAAAVHQRVAAVAAAATAGEDVQPAAATSDGTAVPLELLEEALHWHRYANAIYGWPMFLWSHRYRAFRCCGLCCGRCFKYVQHRVHLNQRSFTASNEGSAAAAADRGPAAAVADLEGVVSVHNSQPRALAEGVETLKQQQQQHASQQLRAVAEGIEGLELHSAFAQSVQQQQQQCGSEGVHASTDHTALNRSQATTEVDSNRQSHVLQQCSTDCTAQPNIQLVATASTDQHTAALCSSTAHQLLQRSTETGAQQSSTSQQAQQQQQEGWRQQGTGSNNDFWNMEQGNSGASGSPAAASTAPVNAFGSRSAAAAAAGTDPGCCCCGCISGDWGSTSHVPKMPALTASQRLTREAIVQTAKIPDSALLHVNYDNLVEGLLPYSVVLDEARRCVVVAIRGSLSVEDCVTDILYDPAPLDADWLQPAAARPTAAAANGTTNTVAGQQEQGKKPDIAIAQRLQHLSSLRTSPFETAAAAAEHAAGGSSSSQTAGAVGIQQQQQQQPHVPEAQAVAAAASAAPAGLARLASMRSGLQAFDTKVWGGSDDHHPQQQQQQQEAKLTMQPSFWRSRLQRYQSQELSTQQQQQQQQCLTSQASMGITGGLLRTLSSLKSTIRRRSSHSGGSLLPTHTSVNFPSASAPGSSKQLQSSRSVNFTRTGLGQNQGLRQVPPENNRRMTVDGSSVNSTSSSRVEQQRRNTAEQMQLLGQVQRTTAADRALGAARAGHKFGGSTGGSTGDQQQQQQQQQQLHAVSSLSTTNMQPPAAAQPAALSYAAAAADQQASMGDGDACSTTLQDGGPTDRSLVFEAADMTPSTTTAASPPAAAVAAAHAVDETLQQSVNDASPAMQGTASSSRQPQRQLGGQMKEAAGVAVAGEQEAVAAAAQAAAAEETPDTGAAGDQWFAHEGILNCARAIRDDLKRLGLLDQLLLGPQHGNSSSSGDGAKSQQQQQQQQNEAGIGQAKGDHLWNQGTQQQQQRRELPDCRGWTLLLTGHSLGAGVAALLALHYRSIYPSVRCWCFGPPGGLMSPAAAASLNDICYSLISAKDMVPRMSLWTIERLRDEMMLCALRCKMPKLKLLLGAAFGREWEESVVLRPLEDMTAAQIEQYRRYRRAVNQERSLDPLRVRIAREFVPPGEVIWLERYKISRPRLRPLLPTGAAAAAAGANPTAAAAAVVAAAGTSLQQRRVASNARSETASSAVSGVSAESNLKDDSSFDAPAYDVQPHITLNTAAGNSASAANGPAASMARASSAALAAALAGNVTVTRLRPHLTDGLHLIVGGMVVSRNMFLDHVPDAQFAELKRLVRWMQMQQQRQQQSLRQQKEKQEVPNAATAAAAAATVDVNGAWRGGSAGSAGRLPSTAVPVQQVMPQRL